MLTNHFKAIYLIYFTIDLKLNLEFFLLKGAGGFMKPHKCYSLFIHYREKESCRSLNYSFED